MENLKMEELQTYRIVIQEYISKYQRFYKEPFHTQDSLTQQMARKACYGDILKDLQALLGYHDQCQLSEQLNLL